VTSWAAPLLAGEQRGVSKKLQVLEDRERVCRYEGLVLVVASLHRCTQPDPMYCSSMHAIQGPMAAYRRAAPALLPTGHVYSLKALLSTPRPDTN
jgi:hypothetical protein